MQIRNPLLHYLTNSLFFSFSILLFTPASDAAQKFEHALSLETQGTYSRLKIGLEENYKPVWTEGRQGFEVKIPGAALMDIGVPIGDEEEFKKYVQTLNDKRILNLEAIESDAGVTIRGKYLFPKGAQALANPLMEHFDFRQVEQGKFILDFWYKKGPTVLEAALKRKSEDRKKEDIEKENLVKKEEERHIERKKRIEEAKNALLFCEMPFDRNNTVFIKYRSDHPMLNFNAYFPEHIPDHRFDYTEPKGRNEEADMARFALKLSRDNKHALVIRTIDFLIKEYPKSRFLNELLFLKASSYYRLEMEDKGKETLKLLAKKARGTDPGLQAAAFLAIQAFKRNEWLLALESFLSIRREFPHHPLNWLFHYGVGECMYQIRQYDKAKEEYEWVAENAPKASVKAEAAFKVGDMNYERNQYAIAIQNYSKGIAKFPDQVSTFPNVLLNLAESYFQLEEYKKAEENYAKFLEQGRSLPSAWRASIRLAELKALGKKTSSPEVEPGFTETINHFPMTVGAVIARLRLLPCGTHGGFDLAGMDRFIDAIEIDEIAGSSMLYASGLKELIGLTEVRSLLSFGKDERAIEQGMAHLRDNPSVDVRKLVEKAMIGGIKRIMSKDLEEGDVFGAIVLYEKYGDYLPLPSHDPVADDLRMRLAKFAVEKGLKTLAMKIIEPYRQVNDAGQREMALALSRSIALEGLSEQEERLTLEIKSLWNSEEFDIKDTYQADQFFVKVSSIRDQSPFVFERDLFKALYFTDKKEWPKANETMLKIIAHPEFRKISEIQRAQIYAWSAEIAVADDDDVSAAKYFREARLIKQKLGTSKSSQAELNYRHLKLSPSVSFLYSSEGEVLERLKKWKEAVALYTEAVENKIGGNRLLFAHARAILKDGAKDSKAYASRSLEKIKQSQDDDVWKNLANKKLEQIAKEGVNDSTKQQQRK